ncbi:RICIN domain-containing protein [Nonomuraea sp. NPDC050547]|uniref:RICIN domain-containing protein n=1 Tax=unclassified Nonomuraea TaxID=2593643 RepID=UPI0037940027
MRISMVTLIAAIGLGLLPGTTAHAKTAQLAYEIVPNVNQNWALNIGGSNGDGRAGVKAGVWWRSPGSLPNSWTLTFKFGTAAGVSYYQWKNRFSGMCLELELNSSVRFAIQQPCGSSTRQQWAFIQQGNGSGGFRVSNRASDVADNIAPGQGRVLKFVASGIGETPPVGSFAFMAFASNNAHEFWHSRPFTI